MSRDVGPLRPPDYMLSARDMSEVWMNALSDERRAMFAATHPSFIHAARMVLRTAAAEQSPYAFTSRPRRIQR